MIISKKLVIFFSLLWAKSNSSGLMNKTDLFDIEATKRNNPTVFTDFALNERQFVNISNNSTLPFARVIRQNPNKLAKKRVPLNAILILVKNFEMLKYTEKLIKKIEAVFPIEGSLQSCPKKSGDCSCGNLLKNNVNSLLTWARNSRGMSTSALYEVTVENSDPANSMKIRQNRESQRQIIDVAESLKDVQRVFFEDLFEEITKIKDIDSSNLKPMQWSVYNFGFRDLIHRLLHDHQAISNKRGYLIIATADAHDFPIVLEFILNRKLFDDDTLVLATGVCRTDVSKQIPFYAIGPGSETFLKPIDAFYELPSLLQRLLVDQK